MTDTRQTDGRTAHDRIGRAYATKTENQNVQTQKRCYPHQLDAYLREKCIDSRKTKTRVIPIPHCTFLPLQRKCVLTTYFFRGWGLTSYPRRKWSYRELRVFLSGDEMVIELILRWTSVEWHTTCPWLLSVANSHVDDIITSLNVTKAATTTRRRWLWGRPWLTTLAPTSAQQPIITVLSSVERSFTSFRQVSERRRFTVLSTESSLALNSETLCNGFIASEVTTYGR